MTDRDFLWCAVNLLLDEEEALAALCPACREEARRAVCPVCGATAAGENASFDLTRYERLKRGGTP